MNKTERMARLRADVFRDPTGLVGGVMEVIHSEDLILLRARPAHEDRPLAPVSAGVWHDAIGFAVGTLPRRPGGAVADITVRCAFHRPLVLMAPASEEVGVWLIIIRCGPTNERHECRDLYRRD